MVFPNIVFSKHDPLFYFTPSMTKKIFGKICEKWEDVISLSSMEKTIYKFLDEYLGDEVNCVKDRPHRGYNYYGLFSKNNKTLILTFQARRNDGNFILFKSSYLTELVSTFFSIEENESSRIIQDWFGDKHGIKKVGDLMKFVK